MNSRKWLPLCLSLIFFGIFLLTTPFTVQSGDTGELVTNAYHLRVVHPPGYPLWTLLYHFPVRYLGLTTPFHWAAIVTSFISAFWLGLLSFRFNTKIGLSLVSVLGSSLIFWRYSVLPDVFALHLFFLVVIFLLFDQPELLNKKLLIFLAALSVANHHTIVFAFPLYVYAVWKNGQRMTLVYSIFFGILGASIYGFIFFYHPLEFGSWGYITNLKSLAHHFLRSEYGTFKLQSEKSADSTWVSFFLNNVVMNCWSVILMLGYVLAKYHQDLKKDYAKILILITCFITYLLTFFFGGGMSLNGFGETVYERFLLQPTLFLFFIALVFSQKFELPKILFYGLLINAGLNLTMNFSENNYSKNTYIEDFAKNSFDLLPLKSIYTTSGDTLSSASYYLHDVLNVRPDVIHLQAPLNTSWALAKVSYEYPEIFKDPSLEFYQSLDYGKFSVLTNQLPHQLPPGFGVKISGLVFQLLPFKPGEVIYDCDKNYSLRNSPELSDLTKFEISRVYPMEYGKCHFAKAYDELKRNELAFAILDLEKAHKLARLSARVLERLCHSYQIAKSSEWQACDEKLNELLASSDLQYYLFKFE